MKSLENKTEPSASNSYYNIHLHIVPVARLEALKLSKSESFRTLKFSRLDSFRVLKLQMFVGLIIFKKENYLNTCSWILMIYLYSRGSFWYSNTIWSFRALKLSNLENCKAALRFGGGMSLHKLLFIATT